ncbi:MAG: nitroreductase family protein [Bacteroidales bacterium]|nr:nitroreductase family protein [Bacteroidales bacterium]
MKIAEIIRTRWSPRAFSDKSITEEEAKLLFEAARWAPSSMNEQPWKYYYALKGDKEEFSKFIGCLVPGNKVWAKNASLLILSTAKKHLDYKGKINRYALHDTGAANVLICLQANELGYQAHQMGGFDHQITYASFGIDSEKYDLVSFIAIGKPGEPSMLPEDLEKSETMPRIRKGLEDIVSRMK